MTFYSSPLFLLSHFFQKIYHRIQPFAFVFLCCTSVAFCCNRRVNGQLADNGNIVLCRNRFNLAFPKNMMDTAAIGTFKVDIFSTIPRMGTFIISAIFTALSTIVCSQLLRAIYNNNAINRDRLENSQRNIPCAGWHIDEHIVHIPQTTSLRSCFTVSAITGPLQTTGSVSLSKSRLTDIISMPFLDSQGRIPICVPYAFHVTKCLRDGRVRDIASRIAVFVPLLFVRTAIVEVTMDFPTPPFPLTTAITF